MQTGDYPAHTIIGTTVIPAAGVRVTVIPPPPEAPWQTVITSPDGCFTHTTQFAEGTKILVHPEAFLGAHPDPMDPDPGEYNIRIATFPNCAEQQQEVDGGGGGELLDGSLVHMHHLVDGADVHPTVHAFDDMTEFRVFAFAIWIVAKFEEELDLTGILDMAIWTQHPDIWEDDEECDANPDLGAYGGIHEVYIRPESARKKFIIGHEMGHWLQQNWTGLPIGVNYNYTATDIDCQFQAINTNSLHGLRSAEEGRDALLEGWGHFVSTYIFDDDQVPDARFKYYKQIVNIQGNYTDLMADNYNVSLLGDEVCVGDPPVCHVLGGDLAWVENKCPSDWDPDPNLTNVMDVSSEIDWMRFFWQLSAAEVVTGEDEMTLEGMLNIIDATNATQPTYWDLRDAWPTGDPLARFDELAPINGVNNGN
jgi:hypothetical protein